MSPAYRAWKIEAGWMLNAARYPAFGCVPVQISLMVPRKPASRDIDNFIKAPIDLLVSHQIITDDKFVEHLTVTRHDDVDILLIVAPWVKS